MYKVTFHPHWGDLHTPFYVNHLTEARQALAGELVPRYIFNLDDCQGDAGEVCAEASTGEKGLLEWETAAVEEVWWREFAGDGIACDTLSKALAFKEWLIREKPTTENTADWAAHLMLHRRGLS